MVAGGNACQNGVKISTPILVRFPLKILQIISGRNINGALTYCRFLSEHLVARGHEVTILCRANSWMEEQPIPGVRYFHSEMNRSPGEIARVRDWAKAEKFDLLHSHMTRAHAFGVLLKIATGIPVIATAHNRSLQLHWKFNDFVIANSHATCKYQRSINRVSPEKLQTVYCFTDLERFNTITPKSKRIATRESRRAPDDFLVGLVGEVVARKGHLYLFRALKRLCDEIPNFRLVLLGRFRRDEAYVKKLRGILIKNGLYRRVRWCGLRSNVQDFMAAFEMTVVPSLEEPLGLVALESLAAGTPVVAADTGGLPEIVHHQKSGLVVPPKNSEALADAIIELAGDPQRREAMGQYGKQFVFQQFDPSRLTDQVVDIYRAVAGHQPMARAA